MSSVELTERQIPFTEEPAMRLLSINGVKKQLGINYQTAKRLITAGKIKSIMIEGKIKVPVFRLYEYLCEESETNDIYQKSKQEVCNKKTGSVNDKIDFIISKHRR